MKRMRARREAMEVKGLASRWACALEFSSHASRLVKHLSARHLLAIKRVRRGITWMVNRTHTIWIIQNVWDFTVAAIWFKMPLLAVIRVRLLSKWTRKIPQHVGCHSMIACQVSWISDEFWIYYNLKTSHLNVLPAINSALVFEFHSHLLHGT